MVLVGYRRRRISCITTEVTGLLKTYQTNQRYGKPGGRYNLGVVAADFDNDGWPDIYVACDMTPSLLYRNHHDGTFTESGVPAGVAYNMNGPDPQAGMGVAVADFDGNGFLDIAKTNFSGDVPSLFKNEDGKFFTDVSEVGRPIGKSSARVGYRVRGCG